MKFTDQELKQIRERVKYPNGKCEKCGAALEMKMAPKRTLVKRPFNPIPGPTFYPICPKCDRN